jgi:alpha-galactosidase
MRHVRALAVLCCALPAAAIHNGLGMKPSMAWRSWNSYNSHITQAIMEGAMAGMVSRRNSVDGVPTSLLDLGYSMVGLDDGWQQCGSYGPEKFTYHNASGYPVVNLSRFPSLSNMTAYAHSLGLKAGWYQNDCVCQDHCADEMCYAGDVRALLDFGFDGIKLDECGLQKDLDLWASLIASHGKAIEIENCHWGRTTPNATWCPWNFYRTSGDVAPNFESVMTNLASIIPFADQNLSTPGCYAYGDMLEIGVTSGSSSLTLGEARSHFGAWAIVSSPLVLSHDVTNSESGGGKGGRAGEERAVLPPQKSALCPMHTDAPPSPPFQPPPLPLACRHGAGPHLAHHCQPRGDSRESAVLWPLGLGLFQQGPAPPHHG